MDIDIIERKALSMHSLHEKLKKLPKDTDGELNFRAKKLDEFSHDFLGQNKKDPREVRKALEACEIERLKERHMVKLMDLMPENSELVKSALSGESLGLKAEELKKIEDAINA